MSIIARGFHEASAPAVSQPAQPVPGCPQPAGQTGQPEGESAAFGGITSSDAKCRLKQGTMTARVMQYVNFAHLASG